MFYYKKNKDSPAVDMKKEHSTLELHIMSDVLTSSTKCNDCGKAFKDGDKCGVVSVGGKMVVEHEECKK